MSPADASLPGAVCDNDEPARVRIDRTVPSIARAYDAALNGKDNYEVDRALLAKLTEAVPEVAMIAWDNRNFLIRVARFLASQTGISQYLDCGSGLPTAENTHQVVQRINPEARVVYVDNDPVVLAHGRALLEENEHTHLLDADIFEPRQVLDNELVRSQLDFSQPVALLHNATLHHYSGDRDTADIVREYLDALAPGSYVVISHFFDPQTPEHTPVAKRIEQILTESPLGCGHFRPRAEIERLFAGLELVEPGLVLCVDWWPDGPRLQQLAPAQHCIVGGVGRKP